MNLYLIVEGQRTEPRLLRSWLPHIVSGLSEVKRPEDAIRNHFFMVQGGGYPSYLDRIKNGIKDLQQYPQFDRFMVVVDAEDGTVDEKAEELAALMTCSVRTEIVVADCCIETWLLGNRKIVRRDPQSATLRDFIRWYDVVTLDPEQMPCHPHQRNRATTHFEYLKHVFQERDLKYRKKNPGPAKDPVYLEQLRLRAEAPEAHLLTFRRFLDALR